MFLPTAHQYMMIQSPDNPQIVTLFHILQCYHVFFPHNAKMCKGSEKASHFFLHSPKDMFLHNHLMNYRPDPFHKTKEKIWCQNSN